MTISGLGSRVITWEHEIPLNPLHDFVLDAPERRARPRHSQDDGGLQAVDPAQILEGDAAPRDVEKWPVVCGYGLGRGRSMPPLKKLRNGS